MKTKDRFIEIKDDGSEGTGALIDLYRHCGTVSLRGYDPIWLGRIGPSDHICWHPRLTRTKPNTLPTVVSFFTKDTPYESLAELLRISCERFGVASIIEAREPLGSWERNCAMKAGFVREMRHRLRGPILWVDADAHLAGSLDDLCTLGADFGVHLLDGWRMLSGTIFFDDTQAAVRLIDRWHERCQDEPDIWDQIHLDLAWEDIAREHDLTTAWLDERFVKIFDRPSICDPIIVHTQASREHKDAVSDGVRGGDQIPDASIRLARSRSRCRPGVARSASASTVVGQAHESAARWEQRRIETMHLVYRLCIDRGYSKIALVGAGRHTREVALLAARDSGVCIACILDDRAQSIQPIDGFTILPFPECPDDIEVLVVSSDAHESSIAQRCSEAFGNRFPIIEPYRSIGMKPDEKMISGTDSR